MNTHNKQSQEDNCVNSNRTLSKDETMVTNKTWNIGKALTVALISAPIVLVGCGGGGGGGGSSTPSPAAPSTPVVTPPSTTVTPVATQSYTMNDLVVPDGFDYNPVENFDLDIDISGISTDRSFVTVYSRYTTRDDSSFKPDYSSKVIAGSLNNGQFASNFVAPISDENLLIEIWFYDGKPPLQQLVSSSNSQITW